MKTPRTSAAFSFLPSLPDNTTYEPAHPVPQPSLRWFALVEPGSIRVLDKFSNTTPFTGTRTS